LLSRVPSDETLQAPEVCWTGPFTALDNDGRTPIGTLDFIPDLASSSFTCAVPQLITSRQGNRPDKLLRAKAMTFYRLVLVAIVQLIQLSKDSGLGHHQLLTGTNRTSITLCKLVSRWYNLPGLNMPLKRRAGVSLCSNS
jgi:hypothetical protein